MGSYFLVFESIGPAEFLILLVVVGIPAGIVWAIVQAVGKRRKDTSHGPADAPEKPTSDKLRELKRSLDGGVITQSEFEAKKAELLREL